MYNYILAKLKIDCLLPRPEREASVSRRLKGTFWGDGYSLNCASDSMAPYMPKQTECKTAEILSVVNYTLVENNQEKKLIGKSQGTDQANLQGGQKALFAHRSCPCVGACEGSIVWVFYSVAVFPGGSILWNQTNWNKESSKEIKTV